MNYIFVSYIRGSAQWGDVTVKDGTLLCVLHAFQTTFAPASDKVPLQPQVCEVPGHLTVGWLSKLSPISAATLPAVISKSTYCVLYGRIP